MSQAFFRASAALLALGLLIENAWAVTVLPPLPTANLVGRYEASSFSGSFNNGDVINAPWVDSSTNTNNAAVTGATTFSTSLGFPTVRFTQAGNQGFTASGGPGIGGTSGFVYFGVLRSDAATTGAGGVANGNGTPVLGPQSNRWRHSFGLSQG